MSNEIDPKNVHVFLDKIGDKFSDLMVEVINECVEGLPEGIRPFEVGVGLLHITSAAVLACSEDEKAREVASVIQPAQLCAYLVKLLSEYYK